MNNIIKEDEIITTQITIEQAKLTSAQSEFTLTTPNVLGKINISEIHEYDEIHRYDETAV